jgi:hypothetical protein
MNKKKVLTLLVLVLSAASVFAMRWQCITFGGDGGMTCRVCAFIDEDTGQQSGGSISCH